MQITGLERVADSHDLLSRSETITFWEACECSLQIRQPLCDSVIPSHSFSIRSRNPYIVYDAS